MARKAAAIAHDVNNVLTVINGHADLLLATLPGDDPSRADVQHIRRAGGEGAELAARLVALAKRTPSQLPGVDVAAVAREALPTLGGLLGPGVRLELLVDDPLPAVRVDPRGVEQVLANLVRNAAEASAESVRVRLGREGGGAEQESGVPTPGTLVLEVGDTGVGMTDEVRARAFEPFYSTREAGRGLGLSTVAGLVRRMGGTVTLESLEGEGTTVRVRIPGCSVPAPEREPVRQREEPVPVGETVLVVEDEEVVRTLAERILRRRGFQVLSAASGSEALEIVEKADLPIDLVLSDVVMPGMSGPETVARLADRGHRFRVLYMSGYTDDHLGPYGVHRDAVDFLPKPFDPEGLVRRIREILDASPGDSPD